MDRNYAEKAYPPPQPEGVVYGPPYPQQNPPGYMPVPQGPPGPPGMPQAGYPPPPPQPAVQYSQQYPNTVVIQQPPVVVGGPPPGPEPPSQMGCAIFVCCCCFWPTGILAIVKAREAKNAWLNGDAARAHASASTARKFIIASVVLGIIFMILGVVVQLLKGRLLKDSDDSDSYYNDY